MRSGIPGAKIACGVASICYLDVDSQEHVTLDQSNKKKNDGT
jgi:hypothetical protein